MAVAQCRGRPRASGRTTKRCLMKNPNRSIALTLLLVLITILGPKVLRADVTGSILGTVHDSTQAVVVGARIVATNVQTNFNQETVSAADGSYRILALPAGSFKISRHPPAFPPVRRESNHNKQQDHSS